MAPVDDVVRDMAEQSRLTAEYRSQGAADDGGGFDQQVVVMAGIACVAVFVLFVYMKQKVSAGASPKTVLLLGQCGSGKTSLFFHLRDAWRLGQETVQGKEYSAPETVSSLQLNKDRFGIAGVTEKQYEVGDCPGHHDSRRHGYKFLDQAACIVYLIDGADKQRVKDAAEQLYEIFTQEAMHRGRAKPLMILVNKLDKMTRGERMFERGDQRIKN